jgi:hypothetical protein
MILTPTFILGVYFLAFVVDLFFRASREYLFRTVSDLLDIRCLFSFVCCGMRKFRGPKLRSFSERTEATLFAPLTVCGA